MSNILDELKEIKQILYVLTTEHIAHFEEWRKVNGLKQRNGENNKGNNTESG